MAVWRSVRFMNEESQRLADLAGVETDLLAVEALCARFLKERPNEPLDSVLLDALCSSAIVRYGRAFNSGVRMGVPSEVLRELSPESQDAHRYFKALRDKWVAHSVNTYEENEVCAWLMPLERGPPGVTGITVRQARVALLSSENMQSLRDLTGQIRERLKIFMAAENARVLAIAQGMPTEPFYQQQDDAMRPGESHPEKARSTRNGVKR